MDTLSRLDVSLVLPCFNEQGNLEPLAKEIGEILDPLQCTYEIIFVDDKSTDASLRILRDLEHRDSRVRALAHSVNCGESAALATGYRKARGNIIITMDSDGQNDPADIPKLLDALKDADAVCGIRKKRKDSWVKRTSSLIANAVRNALTAVPVTDAGCTYRAVRREVLAEVLVFNGMHRFLATMLKLQGYRVKEVEVNHRSRKSGVSKYGIGNRAMRGLVDCLAMRWYRKRVVPARREAGGPMESARE